MSLKDYLVGQFGRPRGVVGRLAGWIMANRPSNRRRNAWTVDLLDLGPEDRVLEVGYGPGVALEAVSKRVTRGRIVGLDHSAVMRDRAAARNRAAIDQGWMRLLVGSAEALSGNADPDLAGPFDRIFAVNVAMFWDHPVAVLRALNDRLKGGGRLALTFQPRVGDKSDAAVLAAGERLAEDMRRAGLAEVHVERLAELSPPAVCVIGHKPETDG
ncbi:MAG: class I SAM-dependent methyltransferase [Kiloniellales bacterium]